MKISHLGNVYADWFQSNLRVLQCWNVWDIKVWSLWSILCRKNWTLKFNYRYCCIFYDLDFTDPVFMLILLQLFIYRFKQKMSSVVDVVALILRVHPRVVIICLRRNYNQVNVWPVQTELSSVGTVNFNSNCRHSFSHCGSDLSNNFIFYRTHFVENIFDILSELVNFFV